MIYSVCEKSSAVGKERKKTERGGNQDKTSDIVNVNIHDFLLPLKCSKAPRFCQGAF